ncbi:MAG: penicillin-binding protein 2 [bacterium]
MFSRNKNKITPNNARINFFCFCVFLFSFAIVFKVFKLQILDYNFYDALASDQHQIFKKLFPKRGEIFLQNSQKKNESRTSLYDNLYPAAVNRKYNFFYAEPNHIENPERTAELLAKYLDLDKEHLLEKFFLKDDPYEPLKHKVSQKITNQITSLGLKGVDFLEEDFRYYPDENIGGHILGFLSSENDTTKGQYGIEEYFNDLLSGEPGFIKTEKDVKGGIIKIWDTAFYEARDGADVVLTIDYAVQHKICSELKKGVIQYGADGGTIIVMNPETGAILGMCSYPDFSPEKYGEVSDIAVFNNPAIFDAYEPGSIFKPVTASIALDLDKIEPNTTYEDTGEVRIGPHVIRNSDLKAHGVQTMTQVLEKSLNTGAIFMARQAGKENFKKYLENFGFGQKTGIELDTEAGGNIESLKEDGEIYMATASFGQGISVTPLQMAVAYSVLANGGKLPKPHIVDKIIKNKKDVQEIQPEIVRQVVSARAAKLASAMLVSVVEEGHAKKAGVKGYYVAGKTGTAQVAENGVYGNKTIHTFAGFAPVDEPKFVLIVKLDNPKTGIFAESTAVPLANKIIEFALNYYGVKPER